MITIYFINYLGTSFVKFGIFFKKMQTHRKLYIVSEPYHFLICNTQTLLRIFGH